MKLLIGMGLVWIFGGIIVVCLHYSLAPWMPITWKTITSIWGLLMVFIVIVCSFDIKGRKKEGGFF